MAEFPAERWPVAQGDEITSEHFEDLRKAIFRRYKSLNAIEDLTSADNWNSGTTYNYNETCVYPSNSGNRWILTEGTSLNETPGGVNKWIPIANPNKYVDYQFDSGLYEHGYCSHSAEFLASIDFGEDDAQIILDHTMSSWHGNPHIDAMNHMKEILDKLVYQLVPSTFQWYAKSAQGTTGWNASEAGAIAAALSAFNTNYNAESWTAVSGAIGIGEQQSVSRYYAYNSVTDTTDWWYDAYAACTNAKLVVSITKPNKYFTFSTKQTITLYKVGSDRTFTKSSGYNWETHSVSVDVTGGFSFSISPDLTATPIPFDTELDLSSGSDEIEFTVQDYGSDRGIPSLEYLEIALASSAGMWDGHVLYSDVLSQIVVHIDYDLVGLE